VAAIGISAPSSRADEKRWISHSARVRSSALALSEQLGYSD